MTPRGLKLSHAGAVVLSWLALSTWAAIGQAAEVSGGLYRDGQLLDALSAQPAAGAVPRTLAPAARAARPRAVGAPTISPETRERNTRFAVAARRVVKLHELLQRHAARTRAGHPAQRQYLRRLSNLARLVALAEDNIREGFTKVEQRIGELGLDPAIRERHRQTVATFEAGAAALAEALAAVLRGEDGAEARALELLERLKVREDPPLLSSGLPYDMDVKQAPVVAAAGATPVASEPHTQARAAAAPVPAALFLPPPPPPTAADLAATIDVQITPEIQNLAATLGNSPVAIYEYVRDKVQFQPYLGSRKGSAETLKELRGNDTDQASLLLALLRAAGIPSRYIRGTVEIDAERSKSWLGVDDAATAASILATAGLNGVAIVNGATVVSVQLTHVWVEAFVPYADYRGVPNNSAGQIWLQLDPSFKETQLTAGTDVLTPMGFNADTFLANYISTFHTPSPLEKLSADVQTYLDVQNPGTTVADIERTTSIAALDLGILPGTLPYAVLSTTDRLSELEDTKRFKVRFHLYNGGTDFIDYTITLPELIGKRPVVQYVGATPADQSVIDSFGGIYDTPPNLVNVKPLLKLDSVAVATATNAIGMGLSHSFDMQFIQPAGASNVKPLIQNQIIAGNGEAIGFDTFLDVGTSLIDDPSFPAQVFLESTLYATALDYLNRVDRGQEQAEGLMQMVTTQDVSEAIVANAIAVSFTFGVPVTFQWTGLIVDADRRIVGPFAVNGDATKQRPYMIVTGMDASIMENRIFEDRFAQEAISTIKILELASDAGIPLCTVTTSIATNCPGFSQPAQITAAVNAALANGHVVTVPRDPITVQMWSGTGYIDMDPATGAAGYIIGGGISGDVAVNAGGATVDQWPVDLTCFADDVTAETLVPPADSPDPGAVFCADDTTITFKVRITVQCHDGSMQTQDQTLTTHKTKKQIADAFGPGDYVLQLVFYGATTIRKITIVQMEITEVGFTADHQLSKWPSGAKIDDPDGSAPTWTKMGNPNDPVAYTKSAKPTLFGKVEVKPALGGTISADLRVLNGGTQIASKTGVMLTGANVMVTGLTTTSPLETTVKKTTPSFDWELKCPGGNFVPIGTSGPHTMYWTDATPITPPFQDFKGNTYSPLYDFALEKATGYVNGASTPVDKITTGIDGDISYNPGILLPAGNPLTAYSNPGGCLCADLAALLRGLLRSIGIDGTVTYFWAGPDATTMTRYHMTSTPFNKPSFRVLRAAHDAAPLNPHFTYHAIVPEGGMLYDPSYGISYPALVFDETANNSTPQQSSTTFPSMATLSGFVCPH